MQNGFLKVAVIKNKIRLGDITNNLALLQDSFDEAVDGGAKVIVMPKNCMCGATIGDVVAFSDVKNALNSAIITMVAKTSEYLGLLFFGASLDIGGDYVEGNFVCCMGRILAFVPDKSVSVGSTCFAGFEFDVGKNLIFECSEIKSISFFISDNGENPYNAATIIVNKCEKEFVSSRHDRRHNARTYSANCGYIYSGGNEGESTTDYYYAGECLIAECGEILTSSEMCEKSAVNTLVSGKSYCTSKQSYECEKSVITTLCTLDKNNDKRCFFTELDFEKIQFCRQRKLNIGQYKTNQSGSCDEARRISFRIGKVQEALLSRKFLSHPFNYSSDKLIRILDVASSVLARRITFLKSKYVVIGVSGGLDSTWALIVCVEAMKRIGRCTTDILAVTMPCFGTSSQTLDNANKLMQYLGVMQKEIKISKSVLSHFEDIGQDIQNTDVTFENAQARERTQVLMDLANMHNGFVVGTGDLSEAALGFCTYGGDQMAMYNVNASLPKTVLRELVRMYGEKFVERDELKIILNSILKTPISPELLPQTGHVEITKSEYSTIDIDESLDSVGCESETIKNAQKAVQSTESIVGNYELIDFFLYHFLNDGWGYDKILRIAKAVFCEKYDGNEIAKRLNGFFMRFYANAFKRNCSPDGVDILGLGLGGRTFKCPSDGVLYCPNAK